MNSSHHSFEEESVWLTPAQLWEHIKNMFEEGELDEQPLNTVLSQGGCFVTETMAQKRTPMYMVDWIQRLDVILQLNGREF